MATHRRQSGDRPAPPAEIMPADSVEDPALRFLLQYWTRLKGARAMPTRAEISPKDLRRSLRYIHMYDVVGEGADFRARLVGTSVFPGVEEDQTGRLVSEHPSAGLRRRFAVMLKHVAATAAPARGESRHRRGAELGDLRIETLWLPLGEGGRVQHVLAQSSFKTDAPD